MVPKNVVYCRGDSFYLSVRSHQTDKGDARLRVKKVYQIVFFEQFFVQNPLASPSEWRNGFLSKFEVFQEDFGQLVALFGLRVDIKEVLNKDL